MNTPPIVFEDEHILVVDKPAGLTVHPGPGHSKDTLVNMLIQQKKQLSSGTKEDRPGIVHRLDKDVSGLMVLSKTEEAQTALIQSFKEKTITRKYKALAAGAIKQEQGKIESFIGRHPKDRKKFYSFKEERTGSKKAVTFYKLIKSFQEKIHLLECQLQTGRTHQIRVHLFSQGWLVLGDPIYCFKKKKSQTLLYPPEIRPIVKTLSRLALYSAHLKLPHPINKKPLEFTLDWPKDLQTLIRLLKF